MRTNIELDDQLVTQGLRLSNVKTKRELINLALKEFVENRQRKNILDLVGEVELDPEYDYKALRNDTAD